MRKLIYAIITVIGLFNIVNGILTALYGDKMQGLLIFMIAFAMLFLNDKIYYSGSSSDKNEDED